MSTFFSVSRNTDDGLLRQAYHGLALFSSRDDPSSFLANHGYKFFTSFIPFETFFRDFCEQCVRFSYEKQEEEGDPEKKVRNF